MASLVKSKLRAARDAIKKNDFRSAQSAAEDVLNYDEHNYNGLVFLGFALLELQETKKSEDAYIKASESSPEQALAWQGLERLYVQLNQHMKLFNVLNKLVGIFNENKDAVKCAETVQKIITLQKDNGTQGDVIDALSLLLPTSPWYPLLSTLPPPDYTQPTSTTTFLTQDAIHSSLALITEITALAEREEQSAFDKEVDRRRSRLGAGTPEQIKRAVIREVAESSRLLSLYAEVVNHPKTSDELRRSTESKVLRYKLRLLGALPPGDSAKTQLREEVDDIVHGTITIEIPDEIAWSVAIESKDARTVEEYDIILLRKFVGLFPASSLSKVISGYMHCCGIPLSEDAEGEDEEDEKSSEMEYEDAFQLALDGLTVCKDSILAHRLVASLYALENDYPNTIKVAKAGLGLTSSVEHQWGRDLSWVKHSFNSFIATALTHHYPPKHHQRALGIIDQLLTRDPSDATCLLARGYVLRYAERYGEAREVFLAAHKAFEAEKGEKLLILEAKGEAAWCLTLSGQCVRGLDETNDVISILDEMEDADERKAQAWWRAGRALWDRRDDDSRKEAYAHFITALKRHSTFAPAYTSLGIYYSEFSTPPDPSRASKCFQRAVELDSREADAARRLASGFADEREWDLVEVVAKRTIEGEGGAEDEGGLKALDTGNVVAAARYKPYNAWAWKAVGVVEMNRANYESAIIALQVALRANQSDYRIWTRLGEAYARSGRPVAALKALTRARDLSQDDWTAVYFTGDVYCQMGLYDLAIATFEQLLNDRCGETGAVLALAESHLSHARQQFSAGYLTRFEESLVSCIEISTKLLYSAPGFRRIVWKTIADAVLELSKLTLYVNPKLVLSVVCAVCDALAEGTVDTEVVPGYTSVTKIIMKYTRDDEPSLDGVDLHWLAIACYHTRASLSNSDRVTEGSARFDLSIAIHSIIPRLKERQNEERLLDTASHAILDALKHSSGNGFYWSALGNIGFLRDPKLAQHAYIKALELDHKNPLFWTDLGIFYLHHGDADLANQAFYRAQVSNPDYCQAWVGQALVAISNQHLPEARSLLEHALTLSTPIPQAEYEYSYRAFKDIHLQNIPLDNQISHLITPYFAMRRYCAQLSDEATGTELFALICERLHQYDLALELLERCTKLLEAAYEETEDAEVEFRYLVANVNVGRVRLATSDYSSAKESFEIVIGLLEGKDEFQDQESSVSPSVLRAQARFGLGLSCYKLGDLENALVAFEAGLEETPGDLADVRSHVAILLAQTLWAMGGDESREAAKDQLLQLIGEDPNNLNAITSLAAIGIASYNGELTQAALSEILSMPIERRHALDPTREVDRLLFLNHLRRGQHLQAETTLKATLASDPSSVTARLDLAEYFLQKGHLADANALLRMGYRGYIMTSLPDRELRLLAILQARLLDQEEETNAQEPVNPLVRQLDPLRIAERAVLISPWNRGNWHALAYVKLLRGPDP